MHSQYILEQGIHTLNGEGKRSLIPTTSWKKREIIQSHLFWEIRDDQFALF